MAVGGLDPVTYLRFFAALVFVLGLIGAIGWLLRRFGFPGMVLLAHSSRVRRLSLVEVLPIDTRHRLVLVRRDGVEHLILIGAQDAILIERGIAGPIPEQAVPPLAPEADQREIEAGVGKDRRS